MPLIMKKTINGQPVKIRLTDGTLYAGLPIGFILPSFENETPLGFLKMTDTLANRTVSRTTYKELFDWATARGLIGTGKPFGVGDGSTTFVIPDGKEIAFKGIGEYEGTVGNHVKSGGLAVGEFIDDRIQNHTHYESAGAGGSAQVWGVTASSSGQQTGWLTGTVRDGRRGDTTEVKSIGCHYYIKAKNVGVPADFVSAIDDVIEEKLSYSTEEVNTGKKWIDGKPIYRKVITATLNQQVDSSGYKDTGAPLPSDAETYIDIQAVANIKNVFYYSTSGHNTLYIASSINANAIAGRSYILEYTKTTT